MHKCWREVSLTSFNVESDSYQMILFISSNTAWNVNLHVLRLFVYLVRGNSPAVAATFVRNTLSTGCLGGRQGARCGGTFIEWPVHTHRCSRSIPGTLAPIIHGSVINCTLGRVHVLSSVASEIGPSLAVCLLGVSSLGKFGWRVTTHV